MRNKALTYSLNCPMRSPLIGRELDGDSERFTIRSIVKMLFWNSVKANEGAPGVDKQDFEYIEDVIGVDQFLSEVCEQLKSELL